MIIRTDYTIDSANGTITFTNPILFEGIRRIVNISKGISIYDVDILSGKISVSSNIVSIQNKEAKSNLTNTDLLRIEYDENA